MLNRDKTYIYAHVLTSMTTGAEVDSFVPIKIGYVPLSSIQTLLIL